MVAIGVADIDWIDKGLSIMNKTSTALIGLFILLIGGVFLYSRIVALSKTIQENEVRYARRIAMTEDSLKSLRHEVDSINAAMPGLGEYMTTIQLHAAKLWYAAEASNWKLASFELNEMMETIEPAEALHVMRNGVNTSSVLESLKQTQLAGLDRAIQSTDPKKFVSAYDQTIAMCNGCHHSVAYDFIHIIRPTREPVVNQSWKMVKEH